MSRNPHSVNLAPHISAGTSSGVLTPSRFSGKSKFSNGFYQLLIPQDFKNRQLPIFANCMWAKHQRQGSLINLDICPVSTDKNALASGGPCLDEVIKVVNA